MRILNLPQIGYFNPKSYLLDYSGLNKTKYALSTDVPIMPDLFGTPIKL
jgi:hypothetical protein